MGYVTKRFHPPGTEPGTLTVHEGRGTLPIRLELTHYDKTQLTTLEDIDAETCRAYMEQPGTTWIHLQGHITPDQLRALAELVELHPLAMEDVLNTGQRPKLELYDHQIFAITTVPVLDDELLSFQQVSLFAGSHYVISIADGPRDIFQPIRKRLHLEKTRLRERQADYLLYALLDVVIDEGFPELERLGEEIEAVEDALFIAPENQTLGRIHRLKRRLLITRRMLWPQRELVNALLRNENGLISDETKLYLRDCYDHTVQIMDLLETYRDMTANMLDIYLSSTSNRLNEIMRFLTVIATLFIPPTFLVGVYGMNFDRSASPWNMPELGWPWGYALLWGVILTMIGGMLVFFKRRKWL